MNEAYIIIQMQQLVNELTRLTRSSTGVNHFQIRKICVDLGDKAEALSAWSTNKSDEMPTAQWWDMYQKHKETTE